MTLDELAIKFRDRKGPAPKLPDELAQEQADLEAILTRLRNGEPAQSPQRGTEGNQSAPQTHSQP